MTSSLHPAHPGAATVFVVDDDGSVRKGLGRILAAEGYTVVTCASAREFLDRPRFVGCGCVVLDLSMPGLSGLDLQAEMARADLDLPIVFVTGHGDVPSSVKAMKGGAVDFLTKPVDADVLLAAVSQAMARHRAVLAGQAEDATVSALIGTMTPRERDVMDRVVAGRLNKQIAAELGISEATVKVHRGRVMQKLGVASVADLVRLAERANTTKV